jgi:hypothetical protein
MEALVYYLELFLAFFIYLVDIHINGYDFTTILCSFFGFRAIVAHVHS